ncbi:hypothetical protein BMS3Bbin10_00459 [bacterium BMS3Bbin10]|nr:hypothetical protein BMS3Bbin10_00459 [bacterium BMS3Bbin10]
MSRDTAIFVSILLDWTVDRLKPEITRTASRNENKI